MTLGTAGSMRAVRRCLSSTSKFNFGSATTTTTTTTYSQSRINRKVPCASFHAFSALNSANKKTFAQRSSCSTSTSTSTSSSFYSVHIVMSPFSASPSNPSGTKWGDIDAKTNPANDLDLDKLSVVELLNLGRETIEDEEEEDRIRAVEEWQRLRVERQQIEARKRERLAERTPSESESDFSDTDHGAGTGGDDGGMKERKVYLPILDSLGRAYGTGKRKAAVARVWLSSGDGKFTVNNVPHFMYFKEMEHRMVFYTPFYFAGSFFKYDVNCTVHGGGSSAQAQALQLGIFRALSRMLPELANTWKRVGFTLRDPRVVERKKVGREKARKKFQWVKR